jgi:hypothetical protein
MNKLIRCPVPTITAESLAPLTGYVQFAALCETLIQDGEHWLAPEIGRTRSTDWMAHIFTRPENDERRAKLATGQAHTMDEACANCVANYHTRLRIEARKAELLQDPKVKEALKLFGHNERAVEP